MLICAPTKWKSKKGRVEVMEGVFVRLVPLLRTFCHKLLLHLEGRRKQKALLSSPPPIMAFRPSDRRK